MFSRDGLADLGPSHRRSGRLEIVRDLKKAPEAAKRPKSRGEVVPVATAPETDVLRPESRSDGLPNRQTALDAYRVRVSSTSEDPAMGRESAGKRGPPAYVRRMQLTLVETKRGTTAVVVLSRRNLLSLLHKLEMNRSARTITSGNGYRVTQDGTPRIAHDIELIVKSETDAEHYGERPFPAGAMHPDTEAFIADSSG